MLSADDVPREPARLARTFVQLPRLDPDTPAGCPVTVDEVAALVVEEVPEVGARTGADLDFVRTAALDDVRCWVWRLTDVGDGFDAYAAISEDADGVRFGYAVDQWGLTPEQFVIGDHFDVL